MLAAAMLILAAAAAFAQNKTISGTVRDERSEPLPGATLVAAGSQAYAITDANGKFSMSVRQGQEITVSYLGYDDYLFSVTGASQYTVSMRPSEATMLNESVAIGYGTTTKKEVTGSVTSLRSEDFDKGASQCLLRNPSPRHQHPQRRTGPADHN